MDLYSLMILGPISRAALEPSGQARRREARRRLELQVRERRAQRRRELVSRALAFAAARWRDYDRELAERVG